VDCIIICRVSDARQVDGFSLDAQLKYGRAYAAGKAFRVVSEFSFQETASKVGQRRKFEDVVSFIVDYSVKHPKRALHVVVEKPDRLGRNHADKEIIQMMVMQKKVVLHYYKDNRIMDDKCSPADILVEDMMTSISRFGALNIGREAKKGMLEKCEAGWMPGKAPWGYRNVERISDGRVERVIVPDPDSKPLVQRIFQLRADYSFSYEKILEVIRSEGLIPAVKKRNGAFKPFFKSTVEKILKNPFYGGTFSYGEGTKFSGKHELIVSPATYARVQQTFEEPGVGTRHHQDNLFGGWLTCGRNGCGCKISFHRHPKNGRVYEHYICANGRRVHPSLAGMYMTEERIFAAFESALDAVSITQEMSEDIKRALAASHRLTVERRAREAESYDRAVKSSYEAEDQIYQDLRKGLLDEEGYFRQRQKIRDERDRYTKLLHESQHQELDAYLERANIVLELAQDAKMLWKSRSPVEKRDFLKKLLWNPRLNPPRVEFEMKKPFRLLTEMASSENWGD
jgi:DNA invertase Pin-like site-specific DNA recombinase